MIKQIYNQCKITALLLFPLFLLACGGSGGGSTGGNSDTITMVIDTDYTVSAGDTVLPANTSARFDIEKNSNENTSTVTLLTGSATIKRG
ncbi:hypothetical protein A9Q81_19670 [Gammaproteobacteria bacterium 42_54_T18]|nr:hypothetical protein A9Q81_19670 [Gammaproteobacteria bacterium 42_54_T18]